LQLIIASDEIIPSPPFKKSVDCNHGKHVIHFGGKYDSYLLVQVLLNKEMGSSKNLYLPVAI
jgi:hypothetical protein